ncbi:hypothetical protein B0H34DRAFT_679977 [Crassisporium funariophilum]|nr:hypothetical protein B0H34DRAFT_679977 [Crassisporium funariophilum]
MTIKPDLHNSITEIQATMLYRTSARVDECTTASNARSRSINIRKTQTLQGSKECLPLRVNPSESSGSQVCPLVASRTPAIPESTKYDRNWWSTHIGHHGHIGPPRAPTPIESHATPFIVINSQAKCGALAAFGFEPFSHRRATLTVIDATTMTLCTQALGIAGSESLEAVSGGAA